MTRNSPPPSENQRRISEELLAASKKREYRNKRSRNNRLARIARGLCARCKAPHEEGKSLCKKHLKEFSSRRRDYQERRAQKRRKLGLCVDCPSDNIQMAMPDSDFCGYCAEKHYDVERRRQDRFVSEGKCAKCGTPHDNKHRDGRPQRLCVTCARKHSAVVRAYNKRVSEKKKKQSIYTR